jgi:hypothetical protein
VSSNKQNNSSSIKKSVIPKPKSGLPLPIRKNISISKTSLPEAVTTSNTTSSKNTDNLSLRTVSVDSFTDHSEVDDEAAKQLQKELLEKEKTLTDLRLESLSAADQLQSMDELVSRLTSELADLRVNVNRSS